MDSAAFTGPRLRLRVNIRAAVSRGRRLVNDYQGGPKRLFNLDGSVFMLHLGKVQAIADLVFLRFNIVTAGASGSGKTDNLRLVKIADRRVTEIVKRYSLSQLADLVLFCRFDQAIARTTVVGHVEDPVAKEA